MEELVKWNNQNMAHENFAIIFSLSQSILGLKLNFWPFVGTSSTFIFMHDTSIVRIVNQMKCHQYQLFVYEEIIILNSFLSKSLAKFKCISENWQKYVVDIYLCRIRWPESYNFNSIAHLFHVISFDMIKRMTLIFWVAIKSHKIVSLTLSFGLLLLPRICQFHI